MPVPTYDLSYDAETLTFTGEISAIPGQLNEDKDGVLGLTVIGKSGWEMRFSVTGTVRDADQDVTFWSLRSQPNQVFGLVLFND